MQTIDVESFKNILLFRLQMSAWGNKRQGDLALVETDADKTRLSLGKKLILCKEYDAIKQHLFNLRSWCLERSMPSMLDNGLFAVKPSSVDEFESHLKESQQELDALLEKFLDVYPSAIDEARTRLNGQFRDSDYPSRAKMPELFSIGWRWIAFAVPEGLSPEIRQKEIAKLQAEMQEASQEILAALRQSFADLIGHTVDRLTVAPGEKTKVFRDSTITNLQDWLTTFDSRNLMNDTELADLVAKAKEILADNGPEAIRKDEGLRAKLAESFTQVKAAVDGMIVDKPARRFDFSE